MKSNEKKVNANVTDIARDLKANKIKMLSVIINKQLNFHELKIDING